MFTLQVTHQENYSKSQLLLRSFFGVFYIAIPHLLALFVFIFWAKILWIYGVFVVLITGRLPEHIFNYQLSTLRWGARLHVSIYNLVDPYPSFGLNGKSDVLILETPYNQTPNRLTTLLRFVLVSLVVIPHLLVWGIRNVMSIVLTFLAFWVVLFTGKYPNKWHEFNVGTLRWIIRVFAYIVLITDEFPPFSGKE